MNILPNAGFQRRTAPRPSRRAKASDGTDNAEDTAREQATSVAPSGSPHVLTTRTLVPSMPKSGTGKRAAAGYHAARGPISAN
ncbi:hypothetical protein [Thetidibacter halocola]|uniref:Uncharacterized protein n=1 Tax=Thetidibacter halocola TaxID=2827239 RepID=A0A8J7WFY5_9RHOB|nr:hypothetical protein [Thetidibacter halocola]MBS0124419.1 hypothetical protein [Thetidibacter halocola]